MSGKQTFEVVLEKHETMNSTGITIPFDVEKVFSAKRDPVRAEINGATWRGSIVRTHGRYFLSIPRVFCDEVGIADGDHFVVTIERDEEPRIVVVPPDLTEALSANPNASEMWDKLSYSHRREYVGAIEEAKRPKTRRKRIDGAVRMIASLEKK